MKKRPIVLCILDGYGLSERIDGNAVKLAYRWFRNDLSNNKN